MNKDFSKYKEIINKLSGKVFNSEFDTLFSDLTQHISSNERFLLKMEIKRLASPCNRLIDLRRQVEDECQIFEHEGRLHLLNEYAKNTYLKEYQRYGSYTLGVYEATINIETKYKTSQELKKRGSNDSRYDHELLSVEKRQYPVRLYHFGHYYQRHNERMKYATALKITIDDKSYECVSSDLSVDGCKFKLNSLVELSVGQQITIKFIGFRNKFTSLKSRYSALKDAEYTYEIKYIDVDKRVRLIGVQRICSDVDYVNSISQFLFDFIQNNKKKYKIDIDNAVSAVSTKSYEQYVLPRINELPVVLQQTTQGLNLKYVLTSKQNQQFYQYWHDESGHATLHFLMNPERIERIKTLHEQGKSLTVYSFVYQNKGKYYFYSADEWQLNEDIDLAKFYLGYAANQSTFRITQLSFINIKKKYGISSSVLPYDFDIHSLAKTNPNIVSVDKLLDDLPCIIVAHDITNQDLISHYQKFYTDNFDAKLLKPFGHKRTNQKLELSDIAMHYSNQRQEPRYSYNTSLELENNNIRLKGITHNFSTSGLKVKLADEVTFQKGDIVEINLLALQKITKNFDLNQLPYQVIYINPAKNTVHLRIYVEKHQHTGRKFFQELIKKNATKLKAEEYNEYNIIFSDALRNIYSRSIKTPSLIIQTSGSRYKISNSAIGYSDNNNLLKLMLSLSEEKGLCNFYPLLGHSDVIPNITSSLKKMNKDSMAQKQLIFISINSEKALIEDKVKIKLSHEFENEKERNNFIIRALKNGDFYCVMMKLSRVSEPNMEYLINELNYISSYAIHRGKQVEQELLSVVGFSQLIDITHDFLFSIQISHLND